MNIRFIGFSPQTRQSIVGPIVDGQIPTQPAIPQYAPNSVVRGFSISPYKRSFIAGAGNSQNGREADRRCGMNEGPFYRLWDPQLPCLKLR
ncbi:MAG: hypothetical protein ABJP82_13150 [Hyphomicrobiales bacterium]